MPLSKYFGGSGEKVMKSMKKTYGDKAESIFYATANKKKKKSFTSPTEAAERREMKRLKPPQHMTGVRG